ncbi:MAG: type II secretion system GspH family protein [Puniceicoccales bacterium]|jgi:prepilin-type N-terminal cleavage/methylation domain-containing protein|nr:type II secretion system GspH family protein [Puniceicoccales bacterium]
MRQGFSLLEVILAIGILGLSLPILLTYMAESATKTEKRIQEILIVNMGKNVQNILSAVNKAPMLDDNNRAYCGYRNGIFTITNSATGFGEAVFVLGQETEKVILGGKVREILYRLYSWNSKNQSLRLILPHAEVWQFIIMDSAETVAWINKAVLGDILQKASKIQPNG